MHLVWTWLLNSEHWSGDTWFCTGRDSRVGNLRCNAAVESSAPAIWNRGSFPARHAKSRPIDLCSIKNRTSAQQLHPLCRAFNWASALRRMRNNDRKNSGVKDGAESEMVETKNKNKKRERKAAKAETKTEKKRRYYTSLTIYIRYIFTTISRRLFVIFYFTWHKMAMFVAKMWEKSSKNAIRYRATADSFLCYQ